MRRIRSVSNEYRRLLKSQFGKKSYAGFVRLVKEGLNSTTIIQKDVYHEIYHRLKTLQPGALIGKHRQLEDVIARVIRIGKMYSIAVGVYLAAVAILILQGTVPLYTCVGIILLTLAFAVKTGEYLGNKFCYVDVRIMINYKTALEHLILESEVRKNEKKGGNMRV